MQRSPVKPCSHRHAPLAGKQRAPWAQSHISAQSWPKRPTGHSSRHLGACRVSLAHRLPCRSHPRQSYSPIPHVARSAVTLASEWIAEATIVTVALLGAVGSVEALWAGQGADGALERWKMDRAPPHGHRTPRYPHPSNPCRVHGAHTLHIHPPPSPAEKHPRSTGPTLPTIQPGGQLQEPWEAW